MLKLYDFAESVCCQKVRLALAEAQISDITHQSIRLDQGEQYAPEFLKLNPKGVVPVLVHNDKVITESTIISEYLVSISHNQALIPSDPYLRSKKQYWSMQLDRFIHNPHTTIISFVVALRYAFLAQLDTPEKIIGHLSSVKDPTSREMQRQGFELGYDAPAFKAAIIAFDQLLDEMEMQLSQTDFLAGDTVSLADTDMAPYIHRLESLELSQMWANRPRIDRWYSTLKARPSWTEAITNQHNEKWVELMSLKGREAWPHVQGIIKSSGKL